MELHSLVTHTELAVAQLTGTVDDCGDHRVIRTPSQPHFWWGNFVAVPGPLSATAISGWIERAQAAAAPGVAHVALLIDAVDGVLGDAAADAAIVDAGLTREILIAMTSREPIAAVAPPAGVVVRAFATADDWTALRALSLAVEPELPNYAAYLDGWIPSRAEAAARDQVRWWGAFADDTLVASAGYVPFGAVARYQDVQTHPEHRRRGIAAAMLSAIAVDARGRGAQTLVIVVGAENVAARAAYRRLGFVDGDQAIQLVRAPRS